MANYNVGDMVKLKGVDELKKIYWVKETMLRWANDRAVITTSDNEYDIYTLDVDDGEYAWSSSCFEGEPMNNDDLKEEYKDNSNSHAKFKVGDRVRVKNDIKPTFGVPYSMVKMAGKTATVIGISNPKTGSVYLKFDEEDAENHFIWFEDLIEYIEDDDTPTTSNTAKHKYDIGDYVRIVDINELERLERVSDDEDDTEAPSGVVYNMFDYASKLARITDINYDTHDNFWAYSIDLDDGAWDWNESMFAYRIGNYEDNVRSDFTYVIGYVYKDITHTFEGRIENFNPNGKSTFIDKNGKILMIPYKDIAYILPIED